MSMGERWEITDKPIYFVHNFTDVRTSINVFGADGKLVPVNSIPEKVEDYELGQNNFRNHTDLSDKKE